jgi:hypothetical protein
MTKPEIQFHSIAGKVSDALDGHDFPENLAVSGMNFRI